MISGVTLLFDWIMGKTKKSNTLAVNIRTQHQDWAYRSESERRHSSINVSGPRTKINCISPLACPTFLFACRNNCLEYTPSDQHDSDCRQQQTGNLGDGLAPCAPQSPGDGVRKPEYDAGQAEHLMILFTKRLKCYDLSLRNRTEHRKNDANLPYL